MSNDKKMAAFSTMSKAEYEVGNAIDNLKQAQNAYKDELMNECTQNILRVQTEEGKLTERDLFIFLSDLVRKVSDVRVPR